ncbi:bifunctional oligoribonuclease/PAP phosphatase NrnA [Fulvivirga maritima]|uniref:DHH family phosphoesterase n=1 Tax=Fulvivirga maritima TaxID=2904247 RepID=UPI001F426A14|nr:bifunctional oligoribonuclease/PAP phosphatase NrnA [Fulvivirga maritima]UII28716.1 bifunctional oligoribonuclease/PAP phosphatase NrnA [Fulvivirga maritima]
MQNLEAFKTLISTPKKVVITTHHKPDADALGSSLGLAEYLNMKGHDATVITPTDYADFLTWMKGNDQVIVYDEGNEEVSCQLIREADIIFCLDFSSLQRINGLGDKVAQAQCAKVLIDHHLEPEDFADFQMWSTEAAATAELIYDLIHLLGDEALINKDIAEALYAGIMTDTGGFKHSNTTRHVFRVCGELVDKGADAAKVSKLVYDTNSLDKLKFLGFALSERLTVMPELNTAYFAISAEDLEQFRSRTGDTEGLVNYALSIEGIKFAALMIDRKDVVKISFRSVGGFSANEFARKHFEGGGHKNAAGGMSGLSLEETVDKFKQLLNEYKNELSNPINTYA